VRQSNGPDLCAIRKFGAGRISRNFGSGSLAKSDASTNALTRRIAQCFVRLTKSHCQTWCIGESKLAAHFKRPAQGTLHAHSLRQAIDSMIETQGSCSIIVPKVLGRQGRNRIRDESLPALTGTPSGFIAVFARWWHGQRRCERWHYSVCLDSHGETVLSTTRRLFLVYPRGRPNRLGAYRRSRGIPDSLRAVPWLACDDTLKPSSPRLGSPGDQCRKHCVLERVASTPIRDVGMRGFCEMR